MKRSLLLWIPLLLVGCQSTATTRQPIVIMQPHEGDHLWSHHESGDELGSGGELQIYIDPETYPEASASFAKYTLGVGGALPVHRHDKTEEFAYILTGQGAAVAVNDNGEEIEIPISAGYVWYNPPGAWHGVRNTGSTPFTLIFATVPNEKKGLLAFFRRISVEPGQEPIVLSSDDLETLAAKHDFILRAPNQDERP